MMKKMLLIINPKSGKNQIKPYLCDVIDLYVSHGYSVTVHTTQSQMDAYEVVKARGEVFDIVVCSGGDGTLDEVSSGLLEIETDKRPVLGYIPAGSTNDFAKSLGISSQIMEAASNVLEGVPFACDIGEFNGEPFIYVAAFGVFTQVSYTTPQEVKNILGHLAYVMEGIKSLGSITSYHVRCAYDGQVIEDEFIYGMVTNSVSVGGFKSISGKVMELDDGLLEILLIKTPKTLLDLNGILSALLLQKVDERYMYLIKTDAAVFTSDEEIAWTLDGEDGGSCKLAEVHNLQQVIEIIRPKEAVINESEDTQTTV